MSLLVCPRCGAPPEQSLGGLCPVCLYTELAAAADPPPDDSIESRLEAGDYFGPYRIIRLIGRGGMGEVYEAEHVEQCRRVALKVLHQRLRRADDRARFLEEGRRAAAVNHPHSVYVFDTDELHGIPVIAMELLPGDTLKDRVRRDGALPSRAAVDAILQVIDGLEAALAGGILHRDVKPSNCFLDQDDAVKIGDFGLSIPVAADSSVLVRRSSFEGTPEFASPEQIAGELIDVRADIYSVGASLYFLLAGRPPFEAPDLNALLTRIHDDPARFSTDVNSRLPRGLAQIVLGCLAKSPAARPQSYAALRRDLAPFSSAAAVGAPLGLRAGAVAIDGVVTLPAASIILTSLVGARIVRDPIDAVIALVLIVVVYWATFEAIFGAAYGKYRCGLRVVTLRGDAPGIWRALGRGLILVLPIGALIALAALQAGQTSISESSMVLALGAGVLAWPSWQSKGFVGLQDVLTGTRVVRRVGTGTLTLDTVETRAVPSEAQGHMGPYAIVSVVGQTDAGRLLTGWDTKLRRRVWLHVLPRDAAPVPPAIRNVSRAGRVHWLNGRRASGDVWDAYSAPDGTALLAASRPCSWRSVSQWLCDLAEELAAAEADGTTPTLTLDRIWITATHRGVLLDFAVIGDPNSPRAGPMQPQQFLYAAAHRALGHRPTPLALSVSECLTKLEKGAYPSLGDARDALFAIRETPDHVSRVTRGMTLALGTLVYLFLVDVLGRLVVNGSLPLAVITSASLVRIAGLVACAALALSWSLLCRSGIWLRAFGVAVVTANGREASRARAVSRAALAWSWVPLQIAAVTYGGGLLLVGFIKIVGLFYAADHPERGLQDRLAGTYLVPR